MTRVEGKEAKRTKESTGRAIQDKVLAHTGKVPEKEGRKSLG